MRDPFLRLFCRLLALVVLVVTLVMISPRGGDQLLATAKNDYLTPTLTQTPTLTVDIQRDVPIIISSPRVLSADSQYAEFAFNLTNVSTKAVRAYAIRQDIVLEKHWSSKYLFSNLTLTGKASLAANLMTTNFDTSDITPGKQQHIVLSVDYVEFADGTTWGVDSGNFAETSAGQRAAATLLSARFIDVINSVNDRDVLSVIEDAKTSVSPPATQSEHWKQGFRSAIASVTERLKRAHTQGGSKKVKFEIRQLATELKAKPDAN